MEKKVKAIECKFVHHIPGSKYNPDIPGSVDRKDTHLVKEVIEYEDGTKERNIRLLYDFQRPFWITKEPYRRHKQKKESEELTKLREYSSTQSGLPIECAKRLSLVVRNPTMRDVTSSPYLYGTDVDSRVFVKKFYEDKFGPIFSPYTVCGLDTEVDIETNELIVITIAMRGKSYTAILKKLVSRFQDPIKQLNYLYSKYIPESTISKENTPEFEIFDNELAMIRATFQKIHQWQPDFLSIWNMSYDMNVLLNVCEKYGVQPKDIFSDPNIPENIRYFKFIEDKAAKVTASGVNKPPGAHERWHKVICPSSFYWIDGMCAYNYVRVGDKAVVGGYSLDAVLNKELGEKLKKLKFEDENTSKLVGVDWHKYMVAYKPLEYIIYNIWDVLSMLELDLKTKDLATSLPLLSGRSSFDNFKSGPKKIIDSLHFFYIDKGRVLGSRPPMTEDSEVSLADWIEYCPV